MPQNDHLTPREAAESLGISPDAVRKLIKQKKLTAKRYDGCHYRIDPVSVEAWMTRKCKAGEAPK